MNLIKLKQRKKNQHIAKIAKHENLHKQNFKLQIRIKEEQNFLKTKA
jgi:uncharacterized protein YcgL (UPF0745 family)